MRRALSIVVPLVLAGLAACGGNPPPPAAAPGAAPAAAAGEAAPTTWSDEMSMEKKAAFMKANVSPRLGAVFKGMNAQHYAEFGCKTCHGPNKQNPKLVLPHLTFKDGKITAFAEKPEVSKFMAEKVTPEMASALGKPPYDPATHKGFGCGGCHTVDMK